MHLKLNSLYLLVFLVFLSIISHLFILWKYKELSNSKENQKKIYEILLSEKQREQSAIWDNYFKQAFNLQISPQQFDIEEYQNSFVIFITDNHCLECIKYALSELKTIDVKGFNNIFVLYDFENKRELNNVKSFVNSTLNLDFALNFVNYPIKNNEFDFFTPSYAVIDEFLHLKHIFIPDKTKPLLAKYYLQHVN